MDGRLIAAVAVGAVTAALAAYVISSHLVR